jgi:hypothetical protein
MKINRKDIASHVDNLHYMSLDSLIAKLTSLEIESKDYKNITFVLDDSNCYYEGDYMDIKIEIKE